MKNSGDDKNNFFSLFGGMDKIFNIVSDMVENEKDHVTMSGDIKSEDQKKIVGKYGVNFILGPDKLDGFKNFSSHSQGNKNDNQPNIIAPMTDIFYEEDNITIVAELPGVKKEDIELHLDQKILTFNASKKDGIYSKRIELDFAPDYQSITENFHNFIYSIVIKKTNP